MLSRLPKFRAIHNSARDLLKKDLVEAMKAKDPSLCSVLRQLHSELVKAEKAPIPPDDTSVLLRCMNTWCEAIRVYNDLLLKSTSQGEMEKIRATIAKEEYELQIIRSYLPKPYTDGEVEEAIQCALSDQLKVGEPNPGQIMKSILQKMDKNRIFDKKALAAKISSALAAKSLK